MYFVTRVFLRRQNYDAKCPLWKTIIRENAGLKKIFLMHKKAKEIYPPFYRGSAPKTIICGTQKHSVLDTNCYNFGLSVWHIEIRWQEIQLAGAVTWSVITDFPLISALTWCVFSLTERQVVYSYNSLKINLGLSPAEKKIFSPFIFKTFNFTVSCSE